MTIGKSKTTKPEGTKKKKAGKPAEPMSTLKDEYLAELAHVLPAGQCLLDRIKEEASGDDDEAMRIWREATDRLRQWEAKAKKRPEWRAISVRYFLVKHQEDSVVKGLALNVEYLDLLNSQMTARGLPPDSIDRLTVAFGFDLNYWMFTQNVAGQFPDKQKDLVVMLLLAIFAWARGRLIDVADAAQKKGREWTAEVRDKQIENCRSMLKHLPAIVHELWPDEFEDYAFSIRDTPESIYTYAAKLYLKLHKKKHGPHISLTGKLDKMIVEEVMRDPDVPQTKYDTFRKGLQREVRYLLLESQKRKKAESKKAQENC